MSLIIKGIDLPKEGEDITLEINHKGEVRVYSTELKETDTDTEAIQIPTPHGRLVDADDIKAKCINEVFESMGTVAITDPYPDDEWADDICDVPTILEAEE